MTGLRQPRQDAILSAEEVACIRRCLAASFMLLEWGKANGGPQFRDAVAEASEATGIGRSPSGLGYELCLSIDYLDFAPARSTR
jgi:hypothetical protein